MLNGGNGGGGNGGNGSGGNGGNGSGGSGSGGSGSGGSGSGGSGSGGSGFGGSGLGSGGSGSGGSGFGSGGSGSGGSGFGSGGSSFGSGGNGSSISTTPGSGGFGSGGNGSTVSTAPGSGNGQGGGGQGGDGQGGDGQGGDGQGGDNGHSFNDYLNGGSGNDQVFGDQGDDWVVHVLAENQDASDHYDGGSGFDTLQLILTADELADPGVQADIAAFLDFIAATGDPLRPTGQGPVFQFNSFDLTARNFEDLKINDGNNPPEAVDDSVTTDEDTPVTIPVEDLLDNDSDPDPGDTIMIVSVDDPTNGTVTLDGGDVIFTPDDDFNGTASFEYTIKDDSGATDTATVTVTVNPDGDPPSLSTPGASGDEDTAIPLTIAAAVTDTDGSEFLTVTISGVPTGASLSSGTPVGGNSFVLSEADLGTLTITPPDDSDVDFVLSVTATSTETESGDTSSVTSTLPVTVAAVADAPTLFGIDATGDEDTAIPLSIGGALTDTDGSELLALITISGVPSDATLSGGIPIGSSSFVLTAIDLLNLTITPPPSSDDDIPLTLTVSSVEIENFDSATTTASLNVVVNAVADPPVINADSVTGDEDTAISLVGVASLTDTDGSESLSVTISGVPSGASLSSGTDIGGGSFVVDEADLGTLTITPPDDSHVDFTLTVTATSTEAEGGDTATTTGTIDVTVIAVADKPPLFTDPIADGIEDKGIPLGILTGLADTDGSESLQAVTISGVPTGAVLNFGADLGGGRWAVDSFFLPILDITPPSGSDEDFQLIVTSTSVEAENGDSAFSTATIDVIVEANADKPVLLAGDSTGDEDTQIPLDITAVLGDTDGSEEFFVRVVGVPQGASLSAGLPLGSIWQLTQADLNGLTITPPDDSDVDIPLVVEAWAIEGENGDVAINLKTITVTVNAVADTPILFTQDATADDSDPIPLTINSDLTDTDGSETLTVTVSNLPSGASLSIGNDIGGGRFVLNESQLPLVSFIPPFGATQGTFTLGVTSTATATENGDTASTTGTINITLAGDTTAEPPTLDAPAATGNEDTGIPLAITAALTDTDGSETLTITINDVPTGASLSVGNNLGGGTYVLTPSQLSTLSITPPDDSDVDFPLSVTATESNGGATSSVTASLPVKVIAVADAPDVSTQDATTDEDTPVGLDIGALLTDTDGSESLDLITISGVPGGASLSVGSNLGEGSFALTEAQLVGLTIKPPQDSDENFTLTVTATSVEAENADEATTTASLVVTVNAVADPPEVTTGSGASGNATGDEDTQIPLNITASLTDTDGSETLDLITVSGVPFGASLSAGTLVASSSPQFVPGNEFQVNAFTQSIQEFPTISPLNDGGFIATWESNGQDGGAFGVFSQRFDAAGAKVTRDGQSSGADEFQVNTETFASQHGPTVAAALGDGGWVVVWSSELQDGNGEGVFAQRFDANGQNVGGEFQVNDFTLNNQSAVTATALDNGGFVVSWTSEGQDGDSGGVFAKQYDTNGTALTAEFQVNTISANLQRISDVSALSDGGYVIVWESNNAGADNNAKGVFGQRYDASSNPVGGEFLVNTETVFDQQLPEVAGLVNGGFVVTWESFGNDGDNFGVFGQMHDASGAPSGGEFQVNTETAGIQGRPHVSALSDGGFIIVWQSFGQDGSGFGIFGQLYDATGSAVGGEFALNSTTANAQTFPDVIGLTGGGFEAMWDSEFQDGDSTGVFGTVFNSTNNTTTWVLTQAELAGLNVTPPHDSDVDFTLNITATSRETSNNDTATVTTSMVVTVIAVADDPILVGAASAGLEDTPIPVTITAGLRGYRRLGEPVSGDHLQCPVWCLSLGRHLGKRRRHRRLLQHEQRVPGQQLLAIAPAVPGHRTAERRRIRRHLGIERAGRKQLRRVLPALRFDGRDGDPGRPLAGRRRDHGQHRDGRQSERPDHGRGAGRRWLGGGVELGPAGR